MLGRYRVASPSVAPRGNLRGAKRANVCSASRCPPSCVTFSIRGMSLRRRFFLVCRRPVPASSLDISWKHQLIGRAFTHGGFLSAASRFCQPQRDFPARVAPTVFAFHSAGDFSSIDSLDTRAAKHSIASLLRGATSSNRGNVLARSRDAHNDSEGTAVANWLQLRGTELVACTTFREPLVHAREDPAHMRELVAAAMLALTRRNFLASIRPRGRRVRADAR